MNIILTRPLIEIEDLMNALFKQGHNLIHLPTLKIKPVKISPINFKNFDAVIFTSSNAVRNLKIKSKQESIKCFCVGSITEKIARNSGFTNTISAAGNVIALKNIISNSKDLGRNAKLVYICGDNISFDLEADLSKEGFKVTKIINYSSEKIELVSDHTLDLIKKYPINVIFVYSIRSAEALINIINNYSLAPIMTQSRLMCISNKIANYVRKLGWKKIEVFNPGEEIIKLGNY